MNGLVIYCYIVQWNSFDNYNCNTIQFGYSLVACTLHFPETVMSRTLERGKKTMCWHPVSNENFLVQL